MTDKTEFDKDWKDDSISLYEFCKKYKIPLKDIFPDCVKDHEKYS